MNSHEVDYEIHGADLQLVEVELDHGESVIAEAGAMNYMEDGIIFETKMGDGSNPDEGFMGKLFSAAKRVAIGESVFITHFTNSVRGKKRVAFAAPCPGRIVPVNLADNGNEIIVQKDSFLAAALGTKIDIAFTQRLGAGFFGGEGFVMQKLSGDGMAFIHAGGALIEKKLNGEKISIDPGTLVGHTTGIDFNIQPAGGLKSMLFGGEGIFLGTLTGTGTIWLQSLPFSRLANRIYQSMPRPEQNR